MSSNKKRPRETPLSGRSMSPSLPVQGTHVCEYCNDAKFKNYPAFLSHLKDTKHLDNKYRRKALRYSDLDPAGAGTLDKELNKELKRLQRGISNTQHPDQAPFSPEEKEEADKRIERLSYEKKLLDISQSPDAIEPRELPAGAAEEPEDERRTRTAASGKKKSSGGRKSKKKRTHKRYRRKTNKKRFIKGGASVPTSQEIPVGRLVRVDARGPRRDYKGYTYIVKGYGPGKKGQRIADLESVHEPSGGYKHSADIPESLLILDNNRFTIAAQTLGSLHEAPAPASLSVNKVIRRGEEGETPSKRNKTDSLSSGASADSSSASSSSASSSGASASASEPQIREARSALVARPSTDKKWTVKVKCPEDVLPGQLVKIRQNDKDIKVRVPAHCRPGEKFTTTIDPGNVDPRLHAQQLSYREGAAVSGPYPYNVSGSASQSSEKGGRKRKTTKKRKYKKRKSQKK